MKKALLPFFLAISAALMLNAQTAWINEFHYDNAGTDANEFVEISIQNAGSYNLADFSVVLYNGSNGSSYNTKTVDLFTTGVTSNGFSLYYYVYPVDGIQNGAPDGIALAYLGVLITGQFLSYEGTFTGVGGPAGGILSADVGVSESSSTQVGFSLQLTGSGTQYNQFTWQPPADDTPGQLNNGQTFGGAPTNSISYAYATSATQLDVVYNLSVASVDPTDYTLTGTTTITFSTATIDGSNNKLVHLGGASANMTGDLTLDNIEDSGINSDFDFYAGIMPLSFTNATNPGGFVDNTHLASYQGIISADDAYNNVWISDSQEAYHGVMIYDNNFDALANVGDEVLITAKRDVYNNQTELVNPGLITTYSTGNDPYGPIVINGSDINETIPVNTDPGEKWEGQLVKIQYFTVVSYVDYDYECSWSDGTTTYYFHIGDNVDFHFGTIQLVVGQSYASVTGVVDWYNTGSYYRINPRSQGDIAGNPTTARIVGSFQGWNTTDPGYVMFENANDVWQLTKILPAGDNEYKVLEGDDWSAPSYPSANQHIILSENTSVTWKVNIGANLVLHTPPVVTGDFISELGGTDWDPGATIGQMTDPDGDDVFTKELLIPAGNWEAKITLNNNWDQSTGNNIPFHSNGSDPASFSYDMATNMTTVIGGPPEYATVTFIIDDSQSQTFGGFFLKGSWDAQGNYDPNWNSGNEHTQLYDDGTHGDVVAGDHIFTAEITLVIDYGLHTWEWGVNNEFHNWVDGNWTFLLPDTDPQTLQRIFGGLTSLVITEIMYNPPESGTDSLEFIEVYNPGPDAVELQDFYFREGVNFSFPQATLGAQQYTLVAYSQSAMNNFFGVSSFEWTDGALSNSGEILILVDTLGRIVDSVNFDDGPPWPADPDGEGPSLVFCDPSLDNSLPDDWSSSLDYQGTNAAGDSLFASPGTGCIYQVPPVVITEIMYNPPVSPDEYLEFIEIHNRGNGNISFNGFHFSEGIDYTFVNLTLTPGEFVVLAKDAEDFENVFGFYPIQWTSGDLDDDGETIKLVDSFGNTIDIVTYDDVDPWDPAADGEGPSLTFCYPYLDNSLGEYWSASTEYAGVNGNGEPVYASPLQGCTLPDYQLVITEIMYNPPESGTDSLEFIEIYNNGVDPVDMEDFYFFEGVTFTFPSLELDPGNYLLVAVNSEAMMNTFGVEALQWTEGALNNSGENIDLRDPYGNQLDFVPYDDEMDWDTLADGDGPSLTFCDPSLDNSLGANWIASYEFAAINADGDSIWASPGTGCGETPLEADFVASETEIQAGETVDFTDLSTGTPISWSWSFPGGIPESSTDQHPAGIQYGEEGIYDVSLTVTNEDGSDTETKTGYINVFPAQAPPDAGFTASATSIIKGMTVDFTDLSTGSPTSWSWQFQGGEPGTSSEQNPSGILYDTPGTYDVVLTASNLYGEDTETKTGYITVTDTIYYQLVITEIMYNPPESGNDSLEFIEIYNNDVVDIDLEGFYFSQGVTFSFPEKTLAPGEYVLVGINAGAMMNTFGVESYQWTEGALNNGGEEIEFRDAYGVVQDYVMFDDEAPWPPEADGAGPSLTLCNPDDDNSLPESWIASTEFAAINQEGDTLWATPLTGCSNIPPVADFIASQTMINVGGAVDFTDLSIGYPDNWSWTFEGGTPETSSEQHPEGILYMNPGTYMVSLTVSNAMGTDTKTVDDYITAGYPPEADFEASATQITVGETVTFTDLTTQDPHTWEWTFQGGIPGTSTEQNPAVFYEMAGDFDVILVATNDFGQSTMHKPLYIHVSVGVSEFREAGLIKAYPNPGDGRLTIEHQSGRIEAEIMDLVGKKVWQYTGDQAVITSDLSEAPRGIYILRVVFVESGEIFTQKLILQ